MQEATEQIVLTGAGGHVAACLAPMLAQGYAQRQKRWILQLVDLPEALGSAEGLKDELLDSCWPGLVAVRVIQNSSEAFLGATGCLLVGAQPRSPGQSRRDLLEVNGASFAQQGQWIGQRAASQCRVVVVGNPCNTMCLVTWACSGRDPKYFTAMTALDGLRAKNALAMHAGIPVEQIQRCGVWGNHSGTCVPDAEQVLINGNPAAQIVGKDWLTGPWRTWVRERGTEILRIKGTSTDLSAARAAALTWFAHEEIKPNEWLSAGCFSPGSPLPDDLFIGVPCGLRHGLLRPLWEECRGELVQALQPSISELLEEREAVRHLLGGAV